ncbi:YggS family pyridoxal phosphate-dependent enzyme [Aquipuribacter sp. SD81]|uniref:YggS family pyridoxal phosphate-dependent enzyme n=1 Tax=Aquipuribacter sp. SD81 TaxID=3127703 RepID=UPI0030163025
MSDPGGTTSGRDERRAELVQGLGRVRARIADACAAVGRAPTDLTLVVVTKTYPASDVALLAGLGVRDVGEARLPELRDKHAALTEEAPAAGRVPLRWHAIGRLQRNKARATARLADVVHSVDDPRLVPLLSDGAGETGLGCFVQVSLDGDPGRGGVVAEDVPALCDAVAGAERLRLLGLMAVAPLGQDPSAAFARLRDLGEQVRADHPAATALSAGMSGDLEQAVANGATHLRVGAAVLGQRPPLG